MPYTYTCVKHIHTLFISLYESPVFPTDNVDVLYIQHRIKLSFSRVKELCKKIRVMITKMLSFLYSKFQIHKRGGKFVSCTESHTRYSGGFRNIRTGGGGGGGAGGEFFLGGGKFF